MARRVEALAPFLEDRETWTFGYGPGVNEHDCIRFWAAGIEAVSGQNPLSRFKGRWTTELGAARVIRRSGGLARAVDSVMTRVEPNMALRGDGGMTADGAMVLIEGDTVAGLDERGLYRLPRSALAIAWSAC